jgi:hypothetical protein
MKLIYIAGPYRGTTPWDVECNVRRAELSSLQIAKLGGVPVCPHSMYRYFDKQCNEEFWIKATMDIMLRCDGALFGPGWQQSAGSIGEYEMAGEVSMPRFLTINDAARWLQAPVSSGNANPPSSVRPGKPPLVPYHDPNSILDAESVSESIIIDEDMIMESAVPALDPDTVATAVAKLEEEEKDTKEEKKKSSPGEYSLTGKQMGQG